MESIYEKIAEVVRSGRAAALCTVVTSKGSTPLKAGAKMIVFEDGSIYGSVGGGRLEQATAEQAVLIIKSRKPQLFVHDLKAQHEMCCGGFMEIFIEPVMKANKLYMFGGGHVGKAVVKHLQSLDFDISVIDSREEIFDDWPSWDYKKVTGPFAAVMPGLAYDASTYIVIATFDHQTDREVLAFCLNKPCKYIGMIGSRNKIAQTREMFLKDGIVKKEDLDRADMPIGIDINAETADEIAISIVAKLIQEKNK
jgi:xanthine dehydrogenase accessory factor